MSSKKPCTTVGTMSYVFLHVTMQFVSGHFYELPGSLRTAVAQWLRRCSTNRKVAVSIPDGVSGFFTGRL